MFSALTTGIVCAATMLGVSYALNRWLAGRPLVIDVYPMLLYGSAVFCLAIIMEVVVNTAYTLLVGEKLWAYHVYPRHDRNVSLLAPLIWFAYGIHLYFADQGLSRRLPAGFKGDRARALITGLDAPLVFEVTGNLVFLALLGDYYAYYLPDDLWHLTSLRVIPLYMLSIYIGLRILRWCAARPRHWGLPLGFYGAGLLFLFSG